MVMPYVETYYRDTLHTNVKRPPLRERKRADVCVIGGGLAGLSTALSLSERERSVVVLEANRIGWGASGRNGGFVARGYPRSYESLVRKVGLSHTRDLHQVSAHGAALIRQRIADYGIDCGPVVNGVLGVAWHDNPGVMEKHVEFMSRDIGASVLYWPADKVRHHCHTNQYYDGYFLPDDFHFHPLNYVHGLAAAIEGHGGLLYEDTRALRIEGEEGHYIVTTSQGSVECDQVVLCCSIYIDGLDKRLHYAAFPVHTFVMVTRPIPEDVLNGAINTQAAVYDDRFAQDYYRRLPDNRILWGGRVSLSSSTKHLGEILLQDLLKVYPQLEKFAQPDYAWAGDMCYAPHKMPQVGEIKPGYWYNTCFGGHGLVPTSGCGDIVARAIAEGDETYRLFEPFSHLHFAGGPLSPFMAQSVYYYWRLRDPLGL